MSLLGKRKLAVGEQSLLTAWAGSADVKAVQSWRSLSLRSSWIRSCMDGMVKADLSFICGYCRMLVLLGPLDSEVDIPRDDSRCRRRTSRVKCIDDEKNDGCE